MPDNADQGFLYKGLEASLQPFGNEGSRYSNYEKLRLVIYTDAVPEPCFIVQFIDLPLEHIQGKRPYFLCRSWFH